jgi:Domain of Unknown Function (DUF748)
MGALTHAGKAPKRFKWTKRIVIALVIYAIIGFFVVPAIIKWQMLKRLPALTHRDAVVEKVRVNPFAFSLTIRGLALKETNGDVFSSFNEFYIRFRPLASLFRWSWTFSKVSLQKPFAQITYRADGTFNFANLIPTNAPTTTPPPAPTPLVLPRVTIYSLVVSNGAVGFADLSRKEPFRTQFIPIDLDLTNLTTIRDRNSPYLFIARTESGESFGWSGTITVNPLGSAGKFRLGGLQLPKYATYAHDYARFDIAGGRLDVAAIYRYDSSTNPLDLVLSNAAVGLTGLVLKSPDNGETNLAISSLTVTDAEASVARQTARVGMIKSTGGSLLVRQEADGIINLLKLLIIPTNAPAAPAAPGPTNGPLDLSAWNARIDEIAFDNYSLTLQDKKLMHPAQFDMDQIAFDVKNISTASNAPVTAWASLRFAGTGTIGVKGTATILPPSADMQITLSNVDVRPIQPYVEEQATIALAGGTVDLQGRARYAPPDTNAPLLSFDGDLTVNNFNAVDDVLFKDFAKWDSLTVDGIKATALPNSLEVGKVDFVHLITSIIMGSNRQPTFLTMVRKSTNALAAPVTNAPVSLSQKNPGLLLAKIGLPVKIGEVVLEGDSLHYGDDFIEPHCSFDVQQIDGTISGLTTDPEASATVDIRGKVDDRSPFSVTGKLNPLATNMAGNMTVTFTNTELTPLSPYTEKYVGRPLSKGKLSFAITCSIAAYHLTAQNDFYVDQLTLGAWNDSADATHLPVKLAVDLLKDRNGRITLDVPVSGRVDDPKFRIAPVIWHVVDNVLVKAATSPFSLLGAAFGGGEELSFVEFEPGLHSLPDGETNKLETLAKALFAHPALTLEINGSVDTNRDLLPMAHLRLEEQLKSLWVKEQQEAGKPAVGLEQVNLDPDERTRLVKKMYKAQIGEYQPSRPGTNQAGLNPEIARLAALLAVTAPEPSELHGAVFLRKNAPKKKTTNTAQPQAGEVAASTAPTVPLTRDQLEQEDMEDQLAAKIEITDDDFHELMQKRANQVQAYLLQTGKVTGDRLFVTTPKAINASFEGQDRANLSLD